MIDGLNFKELYEVSLKATYPIEVSGNIVESGETIACFDKIQIANFQEIRNTTTANGGFGNQALIFWDSTKEIKISFTQGVFSKTQLALMSNSQLIKGVEKEVIRINARQEFESDKLGEINTGRVLRDPIFIYDKATGNKITDWSYHDKIIYLNHQYREVVVDYYYDYDNGFTIMQIDKPLTTGFLSLVGRMRVKDDTTGKVVTGIIKIPKLRLMSDLSIRVGSDAIPQVGRLDAVAVPEGARGQSKVMEIIFLNDDIDADM